MRKATTKKTGKTRDISAKLTAIRLRRRSGDVKYVAMKTGYDQSHVSRVLRGERNNPEIVNAAYQRVSKRKVTAV
jgi:transcriptional regulator with XRE-family HTH domain